MVCVVAETTSMRMNENSGARGRTVKQLLIKLHEAEGSLVNESLQVHNKAALFTLILSCDIVMQVTDAFSY